MISRILVSATLAVGASVVIAAPASADPPNPFGDLGCSCRQTVPEGSPAAIDQMKQGIHAALTNLQGIRGQQ